MPEQSFWQKATAPSRALIHMTKWLGGYKEPQYAQQAMQRPEMGNYMRDAVRQRQEGFRGNVPSETPAGASIGGWQSGRGESSPNYSGYAEITPIHEAMTSRARQAYEASRPNYPLAIDQGRPPGGMSGYEYQESMRSPTFDLLVGYGQGQQRPTGATQDPYLLPWDEQRIRMLEQGTPGGQSRWAPGSYESLMSNFLHAAPMGPTY